MSSTDILIPACIGGLPRLNLLSDNRFIPHLSVASGLWDALGTLMTIRTQKGYSSICIASLAKYKSFPCFCASSPDTDRQSSTRNPSCLISHAYCTLTLMYGTSTSSSSMSSATISKMTSFWCEGMGFFEMNSTSVLSFMA